MIFDYITNAEQERISVLHQKVKDDMLHGWTRASSAMSLQDIDLALKRLEYLERRSRAEYNVLADALCWARLHGETGLPEPRPVVASAAEALMQKR